jgi:ribonuclease HI
MDGSCQYNDGRQAVAFQFDTKSYTGQQNLTYSLQRIKETGMDMRFLK